MSQRVIYTEELESPDPDGKIISNSKQKYKTDPVFDDPLDIINKRYVDENSGTPIQTPAFAVYSANTSQTTFSSTNGEVVWNNPIQESATQLFFAFNDVFDNAMGDFLDACKVGDIINLVGANAGSFQKWIITSKSTATDHQTFGVSLFLSNHDFDLNEAVNIKISPPEALNVDGSNKMLGDIDANVHSIKNLLYIIDTNATPSSNANVRALYDYLGRVVANWYNQSLGFGIQNTTGFVTYLKGLATSTRTATFPNKDITVAGLDDILAAIINSAYGAGWSGDTTHAPSADVLYNKLASLSSAIATGGAVALPFDASAASTFPAGVSTDKYRVSVAGTVQGVVLEVGDTFYPKVNNPTAVAADWYVLQANGDFASKTLSDGQIDVGSSASVRTPRTPSGAVTMSNAGVFALIASYIYGAIMTGVATVTATPILDGETMIVWFNKLQSQITAMSSLLTPASPGNTGLKYIMTIINGTKSYEALGDVNGVISVARTKLVAGVATDWANGIYVGAISGAIAGTKGGMAFYDQDLTDLNWYFYQSTFDNIWYRTQDYKASPKNVAVTATSISMFLSGCYTFTGTTATWTLPPIPGNTDKFFYVKNRGSGNLTIASLSGSAIYSTAAVATYVVAPGVAIILQNDGTYFNVE